MRLKVCCLILLFFENFITMTTPKQCNDFTESKWSHVCQIRQIFGLERFQEETPEAAFRGRERGLQAFTFYHNCFKPIPNTYAI